MFQTKYDFTIIGGDMRQVYMANELIQRNYSVMVYGLNNTLVDNSCHFAKDLEEAIFSSQIIITPIPISKDGNNIISQVTPTDLTIEKLCSLLLPSHKLYGGCFSMELKKYCNTHGIYHEDFMEQDEVILYNTIATAEGAIAEAICTSKINLHGSSCLILGYGNCARTLADKLRGLCSQVTIAARSPIALSAAYASSYHTLQIKDLKDKLQDYPFIFNTIPALVITKELLPFTDPNVVIIDIASSPGGIDYSAANELHRNAKLCLGLPGKYAPKSSATFLINQLLQGGKHVPI